MAAESMKSERIKKAGYTYLNVAAIVACLTVIALILAAVFFRTPGEDAPSEPLDQLSAAPSDETSVGSDASDTESESLSGPFAVLTEQTVPNAQVASGDLILVSNEYHYTHPDPASLASIFENKSGSYKCGDTSGLAEARAIEAFNEMLDDFYAATGSGSVTVLHGYLTPEEAGDRYDRADDKTHTAQAGGSDFHTGLSFSLTVYPSSDGSIGDGSYAWLSDNAYRYGFILRYPEDKLDVTGISPSDGHYRYVGRAAAAYMYENNLCLEEFLDLVERATPEEPLLWDCEVGSFAAYFQRASDGTETMIWVPAVLEYSVSGNNRDGFVVIASNR